MKVLGCDMGNIRDMFLIESGFIGFMGGAVGIVLSMVISMVINRFASTQVLTGMEGDLSRIPCGLTLRLLHLLFLWEWPLDLCRQPER